MNPSQLDYLRRLQTGIYFKPAASMPPSPGGYPLPPESVPPPYAVPMWPQPYHYLPVGGLPIPGPYLQPVPIPSASFPHAPSSPGGPASPDKRTTNASALEKNIEALLLDDESEEDDTGPYDDDDDTFPTLPSGTIVVETDADEIESTVRHHAKLPPPAKPQAKAAVKSRNGGRKAKAAAAPPAAAPSPAPVVGSPTASVLAHKEKQVKIIKAPLPESLARISQEAEVLYERLRTPPIELKRKANLLAFLQRLCMEHWPGERYLPQLHLFGSSANDFCMKGGDVDMCLTISEAAGTREQVVEELSALLRKMIRMLCLSKARIPIVKFTDPKTNVRCDICINNTLALSNTRMLADYASIDSRMRAMGYVVKWWAKARKLNEPYSGTLSSYAFLLMIVNFLQMRQPPVLPCLQRLAEQQPNRKVVDGFDCTYFTDIIQLRGFGSANKESVGELLAAFFRYFAYEFDYETMVLSVRLGRLLTKEEKGWGVCKEKENYLFTLEDPFELTHNLGKVVDINTLPTIRYEFVRAYKLLVENASLDEICEVYIDEEADKKKPRYYTPKKGALKNH